MKKNVFFNLVQGEINRSFSRVWPGFDPSTVFFTETGGIDDSKNVCLYTLKYIPIKLISKYIFVRNATDYLPNKKTNGCHL